MHAAEYEGRPERRPLTRGELQAFFDAADDQVERAAASRRKGWLAAFRDATLFKVVYGWGLRRREAAMLDVADFAANPAAPQLGGLGVCHVRYGKAMRGSPPRRRAVATVMPWAAEALAQYLDEVRPRYGATAHPALWLTERGGRISPRQIDDRFAQLRAAAGLPARTVGALPAALVCLASDRGRDGSAVRAAAGGHSWASTTATFTDRRAGCAEPDAARGAGPRLSKERRPGDGSQDRLSVASAAADGRAGHVRHHATCGRCWPSAASRCPASRSTGW